MLMYNSLGTIGSRKLKPLIEKYGLLEHIDKKAFLDASHETLFHVNAFKGR